MFLEICMQIYSVVFALSRQINKQKSLRKQLISFAQVIKFCKYHAQGGGVNPKLPTLRTPLWPRVLKTMWINSLLAPFTNMYFLWSVYNAFYEMQSRP